MMSVYEDSAAKLDRGVGSTADLCTDVNGEHVYWAEGPNWDVWIDDEEQPDIATTEASNDDLAVAIAHAIGARLYRAC